MSEVPDQVRQGDLLFDRLDDDFGKNGPYLRAKFPIKNGRIVLAEGEKTGHVHTIPESAVDELFQVANGAVIVVEEDTEVTHDTHDPTPLAEGAWLMTRQKQYVPQSSPRPVYD